jgi:hypothetical protein
LKGLAELHWWAMMTLGGVDLFVKEKRLDTPVSLISLHA